MQNVVKPLPKVTPSHPAQQNRISQNFYLGNLPLEPFQLYSLINHLYRG